MERRDFLKLAVGFAAGAAALAATVQAAPLMPHPLADDGQLPPSNQDAHPAVTTESEVEHSSPKRCAGIATGAGTAATGAGITAAGTGVTGAAVTGEANVALEIIEVGERAGIPALSA